MDPVSKQIEKVVEVLSAGLKYTVIDIANFRQIFYRGVFHLAKRLPW